MYDREFATAVYSLKIAFARDPVVRWVARHILRQRHPLLSDYERAGLQLTPREEAELEIEGQLTGTPRDAIIHREVLARRSSH